LSRMGSTEKFCLRWNDFESNISVAFRDIREEKDFFDCTLSCGSRQIQAHKLILSACSPFFRSVLKQNPHQHPLLYLKGIEFTDLQAVLKFMYHGEVNVAQEELNTFLAVAEELKIKGLTQHDCPQSNQKELSQPRQGKTQDGNIAATKQQPKVLNDDSHHPVDHCHDDHPVVVKTEPVQHNWTEKKQKEVASMVENYGEEDDYEYGGYSDRGGEYEDYNGYVSGGLDSGGINQESEGLIQHANGQYECTICGRGFPLKITCRRHVQNVHSDNQRVLCHVCNKHMKNTDTLKAHLRTSHGIYQGKYSV